MSIPIFSSARCVKQWVEHVVGSVKRRLTAGPCKGSDLDRALPSSKPTHRHMGSDKTEQHDNHVQSDDGHEQDDESPQGGRDESQEHSCAVKQDAEERHEQDALPDLVSDGFKMAMPRRPLTHFAVIAAGLLHEPIGPGGSPSGLISRSAGPRQRLDKSMILHCADHGPSNHGVRLRLGRQHMSQR
jgi:hypothetical protein